MKHLESFKEIFRAFLSSSLRIEWVDKIDFGAVYCRKSQRIFEGRMVDCLDLANIQIDPNNQSQGAFTAFLEWVEKENPYPYLFIENVLTERFANFFRRRGYIETGTPDLPSFFKKTDN